MEPRPYQAEAFDAARKDNVVMVGATGVGKVCGFWDFAFGAPSFYRYVGTQIM